MLSELLKELAAAPHDNQGRAAKAVARLYRALHMRPPVMHWARSIRSGCAILRDLRPPCPGPVDSKLRRRADRAAFRLWDAAVDHYAEQPGGWEALRHRPSFWSQCLDAQLEMQSATSVLRAANRSAADRHSSLVRQRRSTESYYGTESGSGWKLPDEHWRMNDTCQCALAIEAARRQGTLKAPRCVQIFAKAIVGVLIEAYWVCLTDEDAVISQPPLQTRCDAEGRPHCEDGPAIVSAEGYEVYALHGVCASRDAVMNPKRLRIQDIELEPSARTRALLIERYGLARYLRDSGAIVWQKDDFGELLWKAQHSQAPLVAVRVRNRTPEPDGSLKEYVLRVPPDISTAKEAVAWTFGMEKNEYQPTRET